MNRYLPGLLAVFSALFLLFLSSALASEWIVQFTVPAAAQSREPVSRIVQNISGVSEVDFSIRGVTITFDSDDTDVEEIQKKLAGAGFPVKKTVIVKEG